MLLDKYEADNILERIPGLMMHMSPELTAIDRVLDDDELYCMIRQDLAQQYPKTEQVGRHSTPVEVTLRMLAVRHLYNWSYERTEQQVADSLVLRQFCRVYFETVPDHTTLWRWAQLIHPETLQAFNERLLQMAVADKLTYGRKLRTDGMVVETTIHHPTDSSLLADSVRVLGRSLSRARQLVSDPSESSKRLFRNRTRSAKQAARQIGRATGQSPERLKSHYQRLLQSSRATIRQGQQVLQLLQTEAQQNSAGLIKTLQTFLPRAQQVVEQATRRLFKAEQVPAAEKLVSIFEPHTAIIRRGKPNQATEFGHKVWLGEVEGGFISSYRSLVGNPADEQQWQPTLEQHQRQFGQPPRQASADRGLYSAANEQIAQALGVKRIILPQPGRKSEDRCRYERQPWFWRGRRFHAGIEGRISVISRKHGLDRCRDRGLTGFERWVGWGIAANNLTMFGRTATR